MVLNLTNRRHLVLLFGTLVLVGALALAVYKYDLPKFLTQIDFDFVESFQNLTGDDYFRVNRVEIKGASEKLASEISVYLTDVLLQANLQVLNIDLEAIHGWLINQPIIAKANVTIGESGLLQVIVTERLPQVLWYNRGEYSLLDSDGVVLASGLARDDYPEFFVMTGQGAHEKVPEIISLTQVSPEISHMIQGFIRVGKRRWDIILDHNRTIKLPEVQPLEALVRLRTLDNSSQILRRDLAVVDLRIPHRTYVRLNK
ncbi:MAG: cell division protein FtsQ/DivIB [Rhodobacteraceae bacterium]|nr:cell division protein FtsQ/DivIB [Paracoccaceae bacterium]